MRWEELPVKRPAGAQAEYVSAIEYIVAPKPTGITFWVDSSAGTLELQPGRLVDLRLDEPSAFEGMIQPGRYQVVEKQGRLGLVRQPEL